MSKYYIDCEFDGHNGPLLSMALICDDGRSLYVQTTETARDPWVVGNVVPLLDVPLGETSFLLARGPLNWVGHEASEFIGSDNSPVIIADSPVDIGRFCAAITTAAAGGWRSVDYPKMTFEVHNVDCYPTDLPGAVQHNAWWDAMALQHKLAPTP